MNDARFAPPGHAPDEDADRFAPASAEPSGEAGVAGAYGTPPSSVPQQPYVGYAPRVPEPPHAQPLYGTAGSVYPPGVGRKPPVYRRAWFWLVVGLVVIALVVGGLVVRTFVQLARLAEQLESARGGPDYSTQAPASPTGPTSGSSGADPSETTSSGSPMSTEYAMGEAFSLLGLEATIESSHRVPTPGGHEPRQGIYVEVELTMTNRSSEPIEIKAQDFSIVNAKGVYYPDDTVPESRPGLPQPRVLAPGETFAGALVFDVPEPATVEECGFFWVIPDISRPVGPLGYVPLQY